jgi:TonB family protein
MGSLRGTKVGAFFLFTAISVFPAFGQDAATTPNDAAQRAVYPESADGLKSLITDLLAAIKSGDTLKSSQLLTSLDPPNHREWFLKSFGLIEAPHLEAKYVELAAKAPDWLQKRLEGVSKHAETNVTVRVFQKPADASSRFYKAVADAMVTNFPIYEAIGGTDFLGDFVYVDVGFRYLDKQVLLAISHSPPMRIKIGGNVQAPKMVDKVQPIYPPRAKQDHIEGTVALNVVIGTDGTVRQVSVSSGPPELVQAAIDAVKQWRYIPTTLNGNPVEVATQVDVPFSLVRCSAPRA